MILPTAQASTTTKSPKPRSSKPTQTIISIPKPIIRPTRLFRVTTCFCIDGSRLGKGPQKLPCQGSSRAPLSGFFKGSSEFLVSPRSKFGDPNIPAVGVALGFRIQASGCPDDNFCGDKKGVERVSLQGPVQGFKVVCSCLAFTMKCGSWPKLLLPQ